MKRKTYVGLAVVIALVIVLAGVLIERRMNPSYDRVEFSGGDRHQHAAVGDFVMAIRHKSMDELLATGRQKADRTPDDEKGAKWLIANYSSRFNGAVRVGFAEPAVSSLELVSCLSFGEGETLRVTGMAEPDDRNYKISLSDYVLLDRARFTRPDNSGTCMGQ